MGGEDRDGKREGKKNSVPGRGELRGEPRRTGEGDKRRPRRRAEEIE